MSDGLNFVVVDEVEVESSHSRTSNRCSFDKLRAWPVGSDLDYCIWLRTPAYAAPSQTTFDCHCAARWHPRRRLLRRTWHLGPATLQRLQGRFRAVQRRASERQSRGRRHRLPE